MQLNRMDCSGRANVIERDTDLGEDLSHGDHSDDDMRECDSVDGDHNSLTATRRATRLSAATAAAAAAAATNGGMSFVGAANTAGMGRSPDHQSELQMSHHHHQFPPNHPLNALGNFMGIGGLHGIPNLQHNDVLEKLKMQVRDMKVGLMEQDYAAAHAAAFGGNVLPTPINTAFTLPPTTMAAATFGHAAAQSLAVQTANMAAAAAANSGIMNNNNVAPTVTTHGANGCGGGGGVGPGVGPGNGPASVANNFAFTSPTAPSTKDVNPASNSSSSSETSNSSQQNNGWSFEEQYKQVRQLYEINDDPKRKEFLDELFSFMQKRGTPINRLPIMAKSVLDLYELYNLVIARGGLVDVINKKLWQEIIKGLHLPSSITSAAFTLRTQYMKYLYPYECEKKNLSTPAELQAAIDGNRREGRRSSYGQYEAMHNQLQMPQINRQSLPGGMQQMSPLALVTHAAANNQQAQAAAAAAAAHHRLMAPAFGQMQMPNLVTHEIEQRMMEYLKLIQVKKEQNAAAANGVIGAGNGAGNGLNAGSAGVHQVQQQRQRSPSPEITPREALNALEMSRVALWQMYHNNTSPPASVNTSPQGLGVAGAGAGVEPQRSEALNLSDSPPSIANIKRERERDPSPEQHERDDFQHQPPPAKRLGGAIMPPGFPASFYLPHGMAAAAAAANFHHVAAVAPDSDNEHDEEDDCDEDDGEHNTTANSSTHDDNERQQLNGHHHHHLHPHSGQHQRQRHQQHHGHSHSIGQHDKSDDSAIENSPSTSAASAGNGHISPISTKKIHLSKPQSSTSSGATGVGPSDMEGAASAISPLETLNLLSGLQFRVARNGTSANGEQQLIVSLELNGLKYSGVLMANAINRTNAQPSNNNNNKDDNNDCAGNINLNNNNNIDKLVGHHPEKNNEMETESNSDSGGEAPATPETPGKTNVAVINGGTSTPTALKEPISTA